MTVGKVLLAILPLYAQQRVFSALKFEIYLRMICLLLIIFKYLIFFGQRRYNCLISSPDSSQSSQSRSNPVEPVQIQPSPASPNPTQSSQSRSNPVQSVQIQPSRACPDPTQSSESKSKPVEPVQINPV